MLIADFNILVLMSKCSNTWHIKKDLPDFRNFLNIY